MKATNLKPFVLLLPCWFACSRTAVVLPDKASLPDTLQLPGGSFRLTAMADTLEAWVSGPVQSLPLRLRRLDDGWLAEAPMLAGVTEGPASLHIRSGKSLLIKPVWLSNSKASQGNAAVYFTPKTINLDSAQDVHRLEHRIDAWRNLLPLDSGKTTYFNERLLNLATRAGTYRGIADRPLSSYYVHAGSCRDITVRYLFNDTAMQVRITAGPLTDDWANEQAGGTLVVFALRRDGVVRRYESRLLHAYASVIVPQEFAEGALLQVSVHRTHSPVIELNRNPIQ
jgi:hypothetical protein